MAWHITIFFVLGWCCLLLLRLGFFAVLVLIFCVLLDEVRCVSVFGFTFDSNLFVVLILVARYLDGNVIVARGIGIIPCATSVIIVVHRASLIGNLFHKLADFVFSIDILKWYFEVKWVNL